MDPEIARTIGRYKKNLEGMGIEVQKIILFGSHASGSSRPDSDVDLAVVSKSFKNMSLLERLGILSRARIRGERITRPMEILGYTEEEYASPPSGSFIADEIRSKGITIEPQNGSNSPLIEKILDKLVNEYHPKEVILFGSYAQGNPHEDSDIDLLIVKDTKEKFLERWTTVRKILTDPKRKVPMDVLILTPEEIDNRLSIGDQFLLEIYRTGNRLYAA